jgi:hypothetical protein
MASSSSSSGDFNIGQYANSHRGVVAAAFAAVVIVPIAVQDYIKFLSYGPGGLPYNPIGWMLCNIMRLMSLEPLSTRPYQNPKLPFHGDAGLLPADLPPRDTARPKLGSHPVPQRQLNQLPDAEMRQEMIARFEAFGRAAEKKGVAEVRQSLYEKHHDAIFVSKSVEWHSLAQATRGEISHIHAGKDGSIHVILNPRDCETVLNKGWGERHALSGAESFKRMSGYTIPINYVLIYAPRNEAEIETAMTIVKTSVRFMTGAHDLFE